MANIKAVNTTLTKDSDGRFDSLASRGPSIASYIAGPFEGDGHIWIPATAYSPSGKRYSPRFYITFALKDLPLAQYLSNLLGGVQIRIK